MNTRSMSRWHIMLLCTLLPAACSSPSHPPPTAADSRPLEVAPRVDVSPTASEDAEIAPSDTPSETPDASAASFREMGSGEYIHESTAEPETAAPAEPGDIVLNFQGVDLREVVKVILGDLLKQNYLIDPQVSGSVTIETSQNPLTRDELLPVLESLLRAHGAALVKDKKLYKVVPRAMGAKGQAAPRTQLIKEGNGYNTYVVSLEHVAVSEMRKILEPFLPEHAIVNIDEKRNVIVLAGTPSEVSQAIETIEIFDVDWLEGQSFGLYSLKHVEPKTVVEELERAFGGKGGQILDGLVRLVPIERLNAVLAVSVKPQHLETIETWLGNLDVSTRKSGRRLFVYEVQNSKAADLADLLNSIFSDQPLARRKSERPKLAPGAEPTLLRDSRVSDTRNTPEPVAYEPPPSPDLPTAALQGLALLADSDIRIIADEVHNLLVVLATEAEYQAVEEAIKRIDILPLQVLIEASIIEVTLNDDLNYGVEWFFKQKFGSKRGFGLLDLGEADLLPIVPSFSYSIVDSEDAVRFIINTLSVKSEVQVLSSPSLMVLDNQTATINVGDEIPVPSRQSISNIDPISPTVNEIGYRDTGVILTVTPRVNASGLITMEIRQEVSNAVLTQTSDIDAPTIQQREIESVVAVDSGETIVLGGLISQDKGERKSRIPLLGQLPLVGPLFGSTSNTNRRSELIVLITPRAVKNRGEARQITREFRQKIRSLDPLLPKAVFNEEPIINDSYNQSPNAADLRAEESDRTAPLKVSASDEELAPPPAKSRGPLRSRHFRQGHPGR